MSTTVRARAAAAAAVVLGVVTLGLGAASVLLDHLTPQVIGFKLTGSLPAGTTATDLVLTVTEILRKKGVVDKFVEFFGDGLKGLPLADRAIRSDGCCWPSSSWRSAPPASTSSWTTGCITVRCP